MKSSKAKEKKTDSKRAAIFKKMLNNKTFISELIKKGGKISELKDKFNFIRINNVPVLQGDSSIDISELTTIFTNRNIDAKKLRTKEWQRKK